MDPAPGTISELVIHLNTIIIASFIDLSTSSINCFAPPLKIMVTDLVFKHSLKILYLSFPICTSSKTPQVPKTSSFKLNKDVWTRAPVALAVLFKSASSTLPAQKIS